MQADGVADALRPGRGFGPFTVLAELASGGMGRIYLARSPGGRTVAVKTLLTDSEDDRRRFAREVVLAQRVRGVYTASVVDADATAAVPWMATEYIPAPSLRDLVEGCGTLGASALYWVAAGMAEALVSIHTAGLVHRDVKPSNVLLPIEGPRVIDFGISQSGDVTRTQAALGTVAYAAPEQARGEPTTAASDVFSLGATLFCLAVGRAPYRDGGAGPALEQLVRAARGELDVSGLPPELDALIMPCLALDPADRPTPAGVLAHCGARLGNRPDARGGEDWLDPAWIEAIERHRERRIRAVEEARRRVDPEAVTGAVSAPRPTARLATAGSTAPAGLPYGRTRLWWAAIGGAVLAATLAGVLVVRPWESEGTRAAGVPDEPVRLLEVESESQGKCGTDSGTPAPADPLATASPAWDGRSFTSEKSGGESTCVVVSTAPGMTVNKFKDVTAFNDTSPGRDGWSIRVTFEDADREKFAELTGKIADRSLSADDPGARLAVVMGDKRLLASFVIMDRLTGGSAVIAVDLGANTAEFVAKALGAP
ncbi:protein kinase [Streptomyces sp. NPDC052236]|uniref:serine/threonine-protein kinase n=1 Tax=Streptomyces sp. NPDC052236 TaxID=3365686 RepID=UPI0037D13CAF